MRPAAKAASTPSSRTKSWPTGSTSHLADNGGHLLEWYRYDLHGTPIFYNSLNTQLTASNYSVRHLFTGQQWYGEIGLYDLRNRFYSSDIGRFVQADPSGFNGTATNLYRYCENNPPNSIDPLGLLTVQLGVSVTVQVGKFVYIGGFGVAVDLYGNVGGYSTNLIGGGLGLDLTVGPAVSISNAETIYGLKGLFSEAGGDAGLAEDVSGAGFWGTDAVTGRPVWGGTLNYGGGAGGGIYSGASFTTIYPWGSFGSTTMITDPGGSTATIEGESIIVTGTPPTVTVITTPWGATVAAPPTGFTYVKPVGRKQCYPIFDNVSTDAGFLAADNRHDDVVGIRRRPDWRS